MDSIKSFKSNFETGHSTLLKLPHISGTFAPAFEHLSCFYNCVPVNVNTVNMVKEKTLEEKGDPIENPGMTSMDISDLLNTPPKFIGFTEDDLLEKFEKYNLPHLGGGSHKKTFNRNIFEISYS